jgi:hypothetical protein
MGEVRAAATPTGIKLLTPFVMAYDQGRALTVVKENA